MDDEATTDLMNRAHRYALSLTHDPVTAEDLVQDAVASVLSAAGPLERPYLFRAVRSRFLDRERRRRVVTFEGLEDPEALSAPGPGVHSLAALRGDLALVLGLLRPEEREALFLYAVEGFTAEEIARMTDSNRNTVLGRLHRARKRIREARGEEKAG